VGSIPSLQRSSFAGFRLTFTRVHHEALPARVCTSTRGRAHQFSPRYIRQASSKYLSHSKHWFLSSPTTSIDGDTSTFGAKLGYTKTCTRKRHYKVSQIHTPHGELFWHSGPKSHMQTVSQIGVKDDLSLDCEVF
jgi:hypothetical protein